VTIFPEVFEPYLNLGMLAKAQEKEKVKFEIINLRDYAKDKHKSVDDAPFGGGPGMVLKVEPIFNCIEEIKSRIKKERPETVDKTKTTLFSAKGKKYHQRMVEKMSELENIILICGRYEGVDERVAQYIADEEISIGDFVLTGGELPAMILADSVSRLLPGVLGNEKSLERESHQPKGSEKDYPVYTRPEEFNSWKVPEILLSGDHKKIEEFRKSG